jgi:hypothetical protein
LLVPALDIEAMNYLDLAKQVEARLAAGDTRAAPLPHPTRELRPGHPEFAQAVTAMATAPLAMFEHLDVSLEVRVRWWPDTLWFVGDMRGADRLNAEGVARHRIWTARELVSLLVGSPFTPNELATLIVARREFNGEVVAVIPGAVTVTPPAVQYDGRHDGWRARVSRDASE